MEDILSRNFEEIGMAKGLYSAIEACHKRSVDPRLEGTSGKLPDRPILGDYDPEFFDMTPFL